MRALILALLGVGVGSNEQSSSSLVFTSVGFIEGTIVGAAVGMLEGDDDGRLDMELTRVLGLRVTFIDGVRVLLTVGLLEGFKEGSSVDDEGTAVGLLVLLALRVGRKLDLREGSLLCSLLEVGCEEGAWEGSIELV